MGPLPLPEVTPKELPVSANWVLEALSGSMLTSCGQKRGCHTPVNSSEPDRNWVMVDFSLNLVSV